jgi:hypothetical protein
MWVGVLPRDLIAFPGWDVVIGRLVKASNCECLKGKLAMPKAGKKTSPER